jgi:hypothetical protein
MPNESRPPRSSAKAVVALAVGLLVGMLLVVTAGWVLLSGNSGRSLLGRVFSAVTGRTLTIDVSQPTVVDRIQRLQRLETVVYTMDKVVTGARQNVLPDFLTGDRLLMMVHGEVVAGIDFSNLKVSDVSVNGKTVRLHLPRPRYSPPGSTAPGRACIRGRPDCWCQPIPTSKPKCARKPNGSCSRAQ